jgi:tetratricopeptide (TPR) repeat protein
MNENKPGTPSERAHAAFQAAEESMAEPNHVGLDSAIDRYREATTADPDYGLAYAKLARAHAMDYFLNRSQSALSSARENSKRASELAPDQVDTLLAQAAISQYTGEVPKALEFLAKALSIDPTNMRARIWQAQAYNQQNDWANANSAFAGIVKADPKNWLAHNEMGYGLMLQGKYGDAEMAFQKAVECAPENSLATNNLASAYIQNGKAAEAITLLEDWHKKHPRSFDTVLSMAQSFRHQQEPTKAIAHAKEATDLNGSLDDGWRELGDCYWADGRLPEAKTAYQKAERLAMDHLGHNPDDAVVSLMLAFYKVKSGKTQEARQQIDSPKAAPAKDSQSQLYRARTWTLLGEPEQALQVLAACFKNGFGHIQFASFPDVNDLVHGEKYKKLSSPQLV